MAFCGGGNNHQDHDVLYCWPSHFVLKWDGQLCILGDNFLRCSLLAHLELQMLLTSRRIKSLEQVMAFCSGGDNHQGHDVLYCWPSHFVLKWDDQLCILGGQFPRYNFLAYLKLQMLLTSRRNESLEQVMAFCGGGNNHQVHDVLYCWPSHFVLKWDGHLLSTSWPRWLSPPLQNAISCSKLSFLQEVRSICSLRCAKRLHLGKLSPKIQSWSSHFLTRWDDQLQISSRIP